MKKFSILPLVMGMSFLAGCAAPIGSQQMPEKTQFFDAKSQWSYTYDVNEENSGLIAYYDKSRRLHFWSELEPKDVIPLHTDDSERASSALAATASKGGAFIAFRDKTPIRDVYIYAPKSKEEPVGVGEGTDALARLQMIAIDKGVGVVWYGEKPSKDDKVYHVYYNEYDVASRKVGERQELFEGIYPVVDAAADGRVTSISWVDAPDGKKQILARSKFPGNEKFEPSIKIADTVNITPYIKLFSNKNRTFALWHAQHGEDARHFKLEGAYTDDGIVWFPYAIKALDKLDVVSGRFAADGKGNVVYLASAVKGDQIGWGKENIYMVASQDNGATWGDLIPIRTDQFQAEHIYSHARTPIPVFMADGHLVVVWEDWRNFRPQIFASLSQDAGKTWQKSECQVTLPSARFRIDKDSSQIFVKKDGSLKLSVEEFESDTFEDKAVNVLNLSLNEMFSEEKCTKIDRNGYDYEKLRARVSAYWQLLAEKKFDETYKMFDPFFRSQIDLPTYKKDMGRIDYHNIDVESYSALGPYAMVATRMDIHVQPFSVRNKLQKPEPKTNVQVPTKWMWIDGDWYLEFHEESRDRRFAKF